MLENAVDIFVFVTRMWRLNKKSEHLVSLKKMWLVRVFKIAAAPRVKKELTLF